MIEEHIKEISDDIERAVKEKCLQSQSDDACEILLAFYKLITTLYNDDKEELISKFIIYANYLLGKIINVDIALLKKLIQNCLEASTYIDERYRFCRNKDVFGEVDEDYIFDFVKRCIVAEKRNGLYEEYIKHFDQYGLTHFTREEMDEFIEDIIKIGNDEIVKDDIDGALLYYIKAIDYRERHNSSISVYSSIRRQFMKYIDKCDMAKLNVMYSKVLYAGLGRLSRLCKDIIRAKYHHNVLNIDNCDSNELTNIYDRIKNDRKEMGDYTYWLLIHKIITRYLLEGNPLEAQSIYEDIIEECNDKKYIYIVNDNITSMVIRIGKEIAEYYEKINNKLLAISVYETALEYIEDDEILDRIIILKSKA